MQRPGFYKGFTLVELIIVIVILGILAVAATPRFLDLSSDAKKASLNNIAAQMETTAKLVQAKARARGLSPVLISTDQSAYIVDFEFGSVELDHRNLCPEAQGELGDSYNFFDFMQLSDNDQLSRRLDNQYALIGYDVPSSGIPTNQGCYVIYDSFPAYTCTFTVVDVDC